MPPSGPDASNASLPTASPVIVSSPPVPSCTRGERCMLDGRAGRLNADKQVLVYCSGKMVVARTLDGAALLPNASKLDVLCYRGHLYPVTAAKLSPSGAYMLSGDERGMLKVWAFDHEEHLCKYDAPGLSGPIRDAAWDGESKRIVIAGERNGASGECARALAWDTGNSVGQLALHLKGRAASCDIKQDRPLRVVTGGKDDAACLFHKGPPFARVPPVDGVPAEKSHAKGAVNCVRYNHAGSLVVSVGMDRCVCVYDGKDMSFKSKLEAVHTATIYAVAWSKDDSHIMTASGDGTCKAFAVSADGTLTLAGTWTPAEHQVGQAYERVPPGGNQVGCAFVQGDIPVSVGLNGQITVLPPIGDQMGDMSQYRVLTGHYAAVADMAVDVARGVFYTGDSDGILCQWDLATVQPKQRLEHPEGNADLMYVVHGGAVSSVVVTSDGTLLSAGWDDKLYVTKGGKVSPESISLGAQPSCVATGSKVAVVVTVQGLLLVTDGKASDMISIPYEANTACVTKDDTTVYVGGNDCKIYVYTVEGFSLSQKHVIENGHLKPIQCFALSNDETKLAAGDARDVVVWDLANGYKALVAKGRWCFHTQRVTCLSWSPDDAVIASGGADDSLYLWSIAKKMKRIHYPYAHRGGMSQVHFLPSTDGTMQLLSTGVDSVVNKWDVTEDVKVKFT